MYPRRWGLRAARPGPPAGLLLALALGAVPAHAAGAGTVVAVLGVELIDTSPGVTSESETRRAEMIADVIRETLAREPGYRVVGVEATRAAVAPVREGQYLHECNGCDADLGRRLGADWVLVGWVQKVSNLILNLNVIVRDANDGSDVASAFVDLRGNTDESWTRATNYLLENILLGRLAQRR